LSSFSPLDVTAILVTRGDVDMQPVIDSLPKGWEIVIWDNGEKRISRSDGWAEVCTDLSVYGRYAAIEDASHELIYVQDDDVIVSDPQAIVAKLIAEHENDAAGMLPRYTDHIVANVPENFRHEFYRRHCLVGFGAAFHRDSPGRAFDYFKGAYGPSITREDGPDQYALGDTFVVQGHFQRTCDIVFTGLSRFFMVDVPKVDREMASADNRMWRQKTHVAERSAMLDHVLPLRDEAIRVACEEQDNLFRGGVK
jgi:hypothetical protein